MTLYWAEALANQNTNTELQNHFSKVAEALKANENTIVDNLNSIQGKSIDTDGYYMPDMSIISKEMRPDKIFNQILSQL